jgi:glycosyltransferase involved in cell wall biosynthesis
MTMDLDVIVATFNRCALLDRTLRSLYCAERPESLNVNVTVVDNNSTDSTQALIQKWQSTYGTRLNCVVERKQGRSFALNAGVHATSGQLVGIIDDDEEIDREWYRTIALAFQDRVDYIGGPCFPRWEVPAPPWLPIEYRGAIGWVECGDNIAPFDQDFPGILMGGNAVLRRSVIDKVGFYSTTLGRTDKGLLSCEDEDLYQRLLESGARGFYHPNLIIYHYIPAARLSKSYFRRWCFWRGVSKAIMEQSRPQSVPYLAGVPRYLYRKAAAGLALRSLGPLTRHQEQQLFTGELAAWDLAGYLYGRHSRRWSRYAQTKSR